MSKGKHTQIKAMEQEMLGLKTDRKTKRAIAEQTGLETEIIAFLEFKRGREKV